MSCLERGVAKEKKKKGGTAYTSAPNARGKAQGEPGWRKKKVRSIREKSTKGNPHGERPLTEEETKRNRNLCGGLKKKKVPIGDREISEGVEKFNLMPIAQAPQKKDLPVGGGEVLFLQGKLVLPNKKKKRKKKNLKGKTRRSQKNSTLFRGEGKKQIPTLAKIPHGREGDADREGKQPRFKDPERKKERSTFLRTPPRGEIMEK